MNDRGLKLSAALSYYTIFSLPPLLIIIISLCGMFFGPEAVRGEIYGQIRGLTGDEAALQLQEIIKNVSLYPDNTFTAIIGVITLFFGASGVFVEIQDSINFIWNLKPKPRKGLIKLLFNRLMSFSMIVTLGFLLLVALLVNAALDLLNARLQDKFPEVSVLLFQVLSIVILFVIITLLFCIIFRTLPDGKVALKETLIGSLFTAVLFMIGKSAISYYLGKSDVLTTYGAAGSIIIILLWVYYSAVILYFGAEFTKVYAYTYGNKITPHKYAVHIAIVELEDEKKDLVKPKADI